jgi:hypothetical protein
VLLFVLAVVVAINTLPLDKFELFACIVRSDPDVPRNVPSMESVLFTIAEPTVNPFVTVAAFDTFNVAPEIAFPTILPATFIEPPIPTPPATISAPLFDALDAELLLIDTIPEL